MPKTLYLITLPVNRQKGLPTMIAYVHGERFEIFFTRPGDMIPVLTVIGNGEKNGGVTDQQLREAVKLTVPSSILDDLVQMAEGASDPSVLFEEAWKKIEPFAGGGTTVNIDRPIKPVELIEEQKGVAREFRWKRQQKKPTPKPQKPQTASRTSVVFPLIPELNSNVIRFKTTLDKITGVGEVKDQTDRCVLFVGPSAKFVVAQPYAVVDKTVYGG